LPRRGQRACRLKIHRGDSGFLRKVLEKLSALCDLDIPVWEWLKVGFPNGRRITEEPLPHEASCFLAVRPLKTVGRKGLKEVEVFFFSEGTVNATRLIGGRTRGKNIKKIVPCRQHQGGLIGPHHAVVKVID
jgi:hypothetical protein